jgi:hypothetical protein
LRIWPIPDRVSERNGDVSTVSPLGIALRLLRRTFLRCKDRAARCLAHPVGLNVNRVASCLPVPNEKCVVHDPQVGDENPLYVFLNPEFDARVEKRVVVPWGGKECGITWIDNADYTFALPDGKKLVSTADGLKHYKFTWTVARTNDSFAIFDLADIDPGSIKSTGVHSPEAITRAHLDENPGDFKSTLDLTLVTFSTHNLEPSIYFDLNNDRGTTMLVTVFQSKDRAERFVTAMKHAVTLCGGTDSEFAPTPSK